MKKILFAFIAVLLFLNLSGSDYKTLMKQAAAAAKKKDFARAHDFLQIGGALHGLTKQFHCRWGLDSS